MNQIGNNNILKGFSHHIDLLNTLNGGVSMATVNVRETEHTIILDIVAPTVDPEAVNVYINQNKLIVFIELKTSEAATEAGGIKVPLFTRTFDIPYFVDYEKIEANYDEGAVKVLLPVRQSGRNYNKKVNVNTW